MKYSPAAIGTCVYTVTASIPETEYKASKDITFTVTDKTSGLPTSIELDSRYFDENGVYKEELVIDETTGNAVITDVSNTIVPSYKINDTTEKCSYGRVGDTVDFSYDSFTFRKAGKHTIIFFASQNGSNWQLKKETTFIVKSANEPQKPIDIIGVPEDDTLISGRVSTFTIKVENPEQTVNWEVTCNNDKIHFDKYSQSNNDSSTLKIYNVYCNEVGVTGTFMVKAWYEGYEANAAIKTFNVHTKDKEFAIWNSIGDITLYLSNDSKCILPSATLYIGVGFNDYKTPIDKVEFSFTPKGSESDILKDVTTTEPRPSNNNARWSVGLHYSPAATGTCVYTATASATVDGKEYKVSKDVKFTVTNDISSLPTTIELDSRYFDENGVYKEELVIDETTGAAVISSDISDAFLPRYTVNGITKKCGYSYNSNDFAIVDNVLIFKKAGKYDIGFFADQKGSNWRLEKEVTFIVKPATAPKTPITITGVPEDDTLISSTPTDFTIKVENPELLVNWEVTCDNDKIRYNKHDYSGTDVSTLEMYVWCNEVGVTGTFEVKAWYYGYTDTAVTATFKVHTKDKTLEFGDDVPDNVTLYIDNGNPAISDTAYLFIDAGFDDYNTPIDKVEFTFTKISGDDIIEHTQDNGHSDDNKRWWMNLDYKVIASGTSVYNVTAAIPDTDYTVSKNITFTVTDGSALPAAIDINRDFFDENNIYCKSELVMPETGEPLYVPFPDEMQATYKLGNAVFPCDMYSGWGGFCEEGLEFTKAGKYALDFIADPVGSNWRLEDSVYFIVKSSVPPENPTPTLSGVPEGDTLINVDDTQFTIKVENPEQKVNWKVSCDNDNIHFKEYPWANSDGNTLELNVWCGKYDAAGTITVKAWYEGYETNAAIATFKVHTQPVEKPTLVIDLGRESTYTLYSGENDGTLTIKTSGSFYLGSIEFSDKSPIHEFEPIITLTPNDEGGAFNCSVYSYEGNGFNGSLENSYEIRIAKLKYESLPAVGTHKYTLHVEIPGTDYTAEAPVTINVIDGTTVLPREIVLLPETEALFTNDVYNQSLYLDSNGKASVSLDLARDNSNESPNLHTVCDKFIYCHDECTKGVTEDRKYMFTFDGAGQHYVVLHLASDYSNWYVERPLTFNVLDPEPVITSEPYYPPYIPPEEPTAMPTAEPVPVPTQAPTAEPVPVPTLAPTVEPAPTPTPAPIMEVTTGGRNLNVRLSPVNGDVVAKLPNGTRLEVLGTENGWSRVRATLPDGTTVEGYVMDVYLSDTKPTPAPATSTPDATLQPGVTPTAAPTAGTPTATPAAPASSVAKVTTDGSALRLRSGPNTRSDILVRMPNNAEVTVLETVDGWTRIRFTARDGKEYEGWASSDFIKPAERPTTPPAPTSAPEPTTPPQPTATPKPNSPARVDAGGKRLNMRTQPGTDSEVVVKLSADADIVVLEYGEEWSLCSYNGVTGYCATAYLKFN